MKFLLAIILALIAFTCAARQSNLAALQDIMNTLQESKSAQTLDADVEAFSKVSSQGLLDKLNEMKQKLTSALNDATSKYNLRKSRRANKIARAEREVAQAKTDKATVESNNAAQKKIDQKTKADALAEVAKDQDIVARIKLLKDTFSSMGLKDNVAALEVQLNLILAATNKKRTDAINDFNAAEAQRRKSLADAEAIVAREEKEARELKEAMEEEQESDDERFNEEKEQCLEELALIERIINLIDAKWFKLGTITTAGTINHLVTSFNDGGKKYHKIKLVNRGGSYTDWARGHRNSWKSEGFDSGKNAIKLDGKWYSGRNGPHKCGSHLYSATLKASDFKVKSGNSVCWNHGRNTPGRCANVIEINTGGKRFQGLSDIETIGNCHKGDNKFRYNFDVYGYN